MKNRTQWAWALAACLFSSSVAAASLSTGERDARKLGAALAAKDYASVARLTHPAVVEAAGGADKVAKQLQEANAALTIRSMTFGAPQQITNIGGTLIGIFPYRANVTLKDKTAEFASFYIGFSADKINWKFIDCEGVSQEFLAQLLPGYKSNLQLNRC